MARIRLHVDQSPRVQPQEVQDGQGTRTTVPFLRVFGLLRVGKQASYACDCIVDPGAPLMVFPRAHWQNFASDVEWLTPVGASAQSWLTKIYGRTGGSSSCRVGRVEVIAVDIYGVSQELAPVWVLAQFEEVPGGDDRILVGLHASILQGRRLHVDPDAREGWIEDH